jgi:hypothetical protein
VKAKGKTGQRQRQLALKKIAAKQPASAKSSAIYICNNGITVARNVWRSNR